MAVLAAAAAVSHAPGLTGFFDVAPKGERATVANAFHTIRDEFLAADVDVLVLVGNDHVNNARLSAFPDFTFGAADRHRGPHEWFTSWLKVPPYDLPGSPALAEHLASSIDVAGVSSRTVTENLRFDDNLSVPAHLLRLSESSISVLPILQNCTVPPIPDQHACYEWGKQLGAAIAAFPDDIRVGLLGSGGMSHEPGGPRYLEIDEKFDRHFLRLLEENDHERILAESTLEAMEAAGSGGTAELLSWLVVMAAAGSEASCRVLGYAAVDEWRSGIGAVMWDVNGGRDVA